MKKVLFFFAFFLPSLCFAQVEGDVAVRMATEYGTIQEAVTAIIRVLSDSGVGIEYVDKDLGIVNTAHFSTGRETTTIQARFLAEDRNNKIIVTATGTGTPGASPTLAKVAGGGMVLQVTRRGEKNSILIEQWKALEALAKRVPHTSVVFLNPEDSVQ